MNDLTIPERALTIRQPWASLIMSGNKLVENRVWDTRWRGTFAVHAGKKTDQRGLDAGADLGIEFDEPMPRGYLGTVDLVDVHFAADECCGFWAEPGVYHLRLENPRPFPKPIPGRGRLGLYVVPDEILAAIEGRDSEFVSYDDMLDTGATARQVDYWARKHYLRPVQVDTGHGVPRQWPAVERDVARVMVRLIKAGLAVDVAAPSARLAVEQDMAVISIGDGISLSLREVC
jgi:hypothetical protein